MQLFYALIYYYDTTVLLDSPEAWQLSFQDSASPIMQGIIELHHDLIFFLIIILCFVFWLLLRAIIEFTANSNVNPVLIKNETLIEVIWTIIPAFVLLLTAVPSYSLLYAMDEIINPVLSIKVIASQWFWNYEYSDYAIDTGFIEPSLSFDSYMVDESDLSFGTLRLLEVDRRVVLPVSTYLRVIISSTDVLHSWAIPALGVKMDACPGRLNEIMLFINRCGVYYGQCSELCGINHGFMPIVIEAVYFEEYASWLFAHYSEEHLWNL